MGGVEAVMEGITVGGLASAPAEKEGFGGVACGRLNRPPRRGRCNGMRRDIQHGKLPFSKMDSDSGKRQRCWILAHIFYFRKAGAAHVQGFHKA